MPAGRQPRTALTVVDVALAENRRWELTSFGLTLLFPAVGLSALAWAAYHGDGLVSLAGAIASALFWPALRHADKYRRENIRIRMYEIPLAQAKDAAEAAGFIRAMLGMSSPEGSASDAGASRT